MKFVLIIILVSNYESRSPAVTAVEFDSEKACIAAGREIGGKLRERSHLTNYYLTCSSKS